MRTIVGREIEDETADALACFGLDAMVTFTYSDKAGCSVEAWSDEAVVSDIEEFMARNRYRGNYYAVVHSHRYRGILHVDALMQDTVELRRLAQEWKQRRGRMSIGAAHRGGVIYVVRRAFDDGHSCAARFERLERKAGKPIPRHVRRTARSISERTEEAGARHAR